MSLLLPHLSESACKAGIDLLLDTFGTTNVPGHLSIICNVARLLNPDDRQEVLRNAHGMSREPQHRGASGLMPLLEFLER